MRALPGDGREENQLF